MSTAATSFPERNAAEVADLVLTREAAAPEVVARRARQRRQMYVGQVASYSLGASVLLLYAYDGAVHINVPSLFWVGGLLIIGIFVVMSEARVGDGTPVVRACVTSARTTEADIEWVVREMTRLVAQPSEVLA